MRKVVFIIAPQSFRDEELFDSKDELELAGFETVIASTIKGECIGMLGEIANSKLTIEEINSSEFDAIIFIGGRGADIYFKNPAVLNLAKEFYKSGKTIAAICIAPSILANAGLLEGKNATAYPSEKNNLLNNGAKFSENSVIRDGKIVTASGPHVARSFGKEIVTVLNSI